MTERGARWTGRQARPVAAVLAVLALGLAGCGQGTSTAPVGLAVRAQPTAAPTATSARSGGLTVALALATGAVRAGTPATLDVRWHDDDGLLLGTLQEWGDGVGAGSQVPLEPCRGSRPGRGTDRPTHTWARPGTYTVHVQVSTFACAGPQESVDLTLPVTVLP